MQYKGPEAKVKVKGLGKFDTQIFSPQTISGKTFKENTAIDVWVTDDENRLPLIIETPISVGYVKAVLYNYNGLKNEVTAKAK